MSYGIKIKISNMSGLILLLFSMVAIGIDREPNTQIPSINTIVVEGDQLVTNADSKTNMVVIIGASYVRAWPIQELDGKKVLNKGVDGQQSFEMLQRFEKDVISVNPSAVIIWGFINDIHRTQAEYINSAMARARQSIEEMVRMAKQHGIQPILATEVTIRGKDDFGSRVAGWLGAIRGKTSYQEYVNGHVLETNRWIKKYAEENQILLLDLQPIIADEEGFRKKEFATEDGTHISTAAYEKMTTYTNAVFESSRAR